MSKGSRVYNDIKERVLGAKSLFWGVNVTRSLSANRINTDELGTPKTMYYGDVLRNYISSQSKKRAMREYLAKHTDPLGIRTLDPARYIAGFICEKDRSINEDTAYKMAVDIAKKAGLPLGEKGKNKDKLDAPFFIGAHQAMDLADAAIRGETDKEKCKDTLRNNPDIDLAAFGRMLAGDTSLNVDAAMQLGYIFTTHEAKFSDDFMSAIDDIKKARGESGAANLMNNLFDTGTFYEYANINVTDLVKKFDGDVEKAIHIACLLTEAFVYALPSGKMNSHATWVAPESVMITIHDSMPVSFQNAFEEPVKSESKNKGYAKESVRRLFATEKAIFEAHDRIKPLSAFYLTTFDDVGEAEGIREPNFSTLLDDIAKTTRQYL